ncbi:MAG: helix-turn-helix transcriptional regulator [Bacteroidales bacterium]
MHKIDLLTIFAMDFIKYIFIMHVGKNIKKIRESRKLLQKEVAIAAGLHPANYNKTEKGEREPSIDALDKIAKLFNMTVDEIIHFEGKVPKDVTLEDKTTTEQIKLVQQLDEDDKKALFRIINTMVTKSKFKDFFQQQLQH